MTKKKHLSNMERLNLLEAYLSSRKSRYQFERENGLSVGAIHYWLRIFEVEDKPSQQKMATKVSPTEEELRKEVETLRLKTARLEHELKESNMAREAYKLMIELAESKYAMPIRKNSAAK